MLVTLKHTVIDSPSSQIWTSWSFTAGPLSSGLIEDRENKIYTREEGRWKEDAGSGIGDVFDLPFLRYVVSLGYVRERELDLSFRVKKTGGKVSSDGDLRRPLEREE